MFIFLGSLPFSTPSTHSNISSIIFIPVTKLSGLKFKTLFDAKCKKSKPFVKSILPSKDIISSPKLLFVTLRVNCCPGAKDLLPSHAPPGVTA